LNAFERAQKLSPLAPHFADDEVGQLAASLDDYSLRLSDLVERDREFNADVSHELRTPLSVIRGAAELMMSQPDLDEKTRQRVKRIERAVRQSTELTTALLHLSRNERAMPGDTLSCDVGTLIDTIVDTNRALLGSKAIEVTISLHFPLKVAAPDAVVAVALGNLIGNAFKYTQQGRVDIFIENDRVEVHDTGPGVRESESSKLFERGYRGEQTTGKGAGIGLALVRRLCDLYGWQVSLASKANQVGAIARLQFLTSP
jgi:signal transduction histidine kinase